MLRKTMIVLLALAAVLAVPTSWAAEPRPHDDFYWGGRKTPYSVYKTWPESAQVPYVGWVMEGGWAAYLMSGGNWSNFDTPLQNCWFAPRDIWQDIQNDDNSTNSGMPLRTMAWSKYYWACRLDRHPRRSLDVTTHAMYQAWPAPQRLQYLEGVLEGIEIAFWHHWGWYPKKISTVIKGCRVDAPALSAALAETPAPKDGRQPMAKAVFTAHVAVCRAAQVK